MSGLKDIASTLLNNAFNYPIVTMFDIEAIIANFTERLKSRENVCGICAFGSYAKYGAIDQYSDIDLGVFLKDCLSLNYLPPFSFYVHGKTGKIEVNLSQYILDEEYNAQWDSAKQEAFQNCIIFYQVDDALDQLIQKKLGSTQEHFRILVDSVNQFNWKVKYHAKNAYHRGYPNASHLLINEGLMLLIRCLFSLNMKYPPHTKWITREIGSLEVAPKEVVSMLDDALLVTGLSQSDIEKRIGTLTTLEAWIIERANKTFNAFPASPYKYWARFLSQRQVNPQPFSDMFITLWKDKLPRQDLERISDFIAFSLISNLSELKDAMNNYNSSAELFYLPGRLVTKLISQLDSSGEN